MTRIFDVFFDLCLGKLLSKRSWRRWFDTPSRWLWRQCKLWRQCNDTSHHALIWSSYHIILHVMAYQPIMLLLTLHIAHIYLREIMSINYRFINQISSTYLTLCHSILTLLFTYSSFHALRDHVAPHHVNEYLVFGLHEIMRYDMTWQDREYNFESYRTSYTQLF